jgi:phenylacetate-CoA ligase
VLERLEGRVGDTIILPSGKKTAAFTFYYITRSLLETWEIFRELQIRQTAPDEFTFDIVSDVPLSREQEAEIHRLTARYFEPGLRLRINRLDTIPGSASGKRRHFQPLPDTGQGPADSGTNRAATPHRHDS